MKYLLILCILLAACGSGLEGVEVPDDNPLDSVEVRYELLPQPVYVADEYLFEPMQIAIDGLNNSSIGPVFELVSSEGPDVLTFAHCDPQEVLKGHYAMASVRWVGDYIVLAVIGVDCNAELTVDALSHVLAHELYHCLGFGHSDDKLCLNYGGILNADISIEDYICSEMINEFNARYGGAM